MAPRRIAPSSVAVFERASHVVVVVQQSSTTPRDAKRLLRILRRDGGWVSVVLSTSDNARARTLLEDCLV